jgi:hypothetical protein
VLTADPTPLEQVQKIALHGPADKRLGHQGLDGKHGRLFVANMANANFDVIDFKAGRLQCSCMNHKLYPQRPHRRTVGPGSTFSGVRLLPGCVTFCC